MYVCVYVYFKMFKMVPFFGRSEALLWLGFDIKIEKFTVHLRNHLAPSVCLSHKFQFVSHSIPGNGSRYLNGHWQFERRILFFFF